MSEFWKLIVEYVGEVESVTGSTNNISRVQVTSCHRRMQSLVPFGSIQIFSNNKIILVVQKKKKRKERSRIFLFFFLGPLRCCKLNKVMV